MAEKFFSVLGLGLSLVGTGSLHASDDSKHPLVCREKLIKRYGDKNPKYSANDSLINRLLSAAGKIERGELVVTSLAAAPKSKNPEEEDFKEFNRILRNPTLEKSIPNQNVADLQAVSLNPREIAHMLVTSYHYGYICPSYKNPHDAKSLDVFLPAHLVRYHIRNGTLPSLVSFVDEEQLRKSGKASQHHPAPPTVSPAHHDQQQLQESIRTAADTSTEGAPTSSLTVPPPLPLKEEKTLAMPPQAPNQRGVQPPQKKSSEASNFIDDMEPTKKTKKAPPKKTSSGFDELSSDQTDDSGPNEQGGYDPYGSLDFLTKKDK